MRTDRFAWLLAVCLVLAGCNTIEGLGHDVATGANTVGSWVGWR